MKNKKLKKLIKSIINEQPIKDPNDSTAISQADQGKEQFISGSNVLGGYGTVAELQENALCGIGSNIGGVHQATNETFNVSLLEVTYNAATTEYGDSLLDTDVDGVIISALGDGATPCAEDALTLDHFYGCCTNANNQAYWAGEQDITIPDAISNFTNLEMHSFDANTNTCYCPTPTYCGGEFGNCNNDAMNDGNVYLIGCNLAPSQWSLTNSFANWLSGVDTEEGGEGLLGNLVDPAGGTAFPDMVPACAVTVDDDDVIGCLDNGEISGTSVMPNGILFPYTTGIAPNGGTWGVPACNYGEAYDINGNLIDTFEGEDVYGEIEYDDGTICDYSCHGCTDETATNYDSGATIDDGTCLSFGCTNPFATNYCCEQGTDNFQNDDLFVDDGYQCEFDFCGDEDVDGLPSTNYVCNLSEGASGAILALMEEIENALCIYDDASGTNIANTDLGDFVGECTTAADTGELVQCGDPQAVSCSEYPYLVDIGGTGQNGCYTPQAAGNSCGGSGADASYDCCVYAYCPEEGLDGLYFNGPYVDHPSGQWIEVDPSTGFGTGIQDDSLCAYIGCNNYTVLSEIPPEYVTGLPGSSDPNAQPGQVIPGAFASDPDGINSEYPLYYFHPDNAGCQGEGDGAPNANDTSCCYVPGCMDPDADYDSFNPLATIDELGYSYDQQTGEMLWNSCVYSQMGCTELESGYDDATGQAITTVVTPDNVYALNHNSEATDDDGSCLFCKKITAIQCSPPLPPIDPASVGGTPTYLPGSPENPVTVDCLSFKAGSGYQWEVAKYEPEPGMVYTDDATEYDFNACQEPEACNYYQDVYADYPELWDWITGNSGCQYPEDLYPDMQAPNPYTGNMEVYVDCDGNCLNDSNGDGICDETQEYGCTDTNAINYNPDAVLPAPDGTFNSCYYEASGCTNQFAPNYDPDAVGCPNEWGAPDADDQSCCDALPECYTCEQYDGGNNFGNQAYTEYGDKRGGYRVPYSAPASQMGQCHGFLGLTSRGTPSDPCCQLNVTNSQRIWNMSGQVIPSTPSMGSNAVSSFNVMGGSYLYNGMAVLFSWNAPELSDWIQTCGVSNNSFIKNYWNCSWTAESEYNETYSVTNSSCGFGLQMTNVAGRQYACQYTNQQLGYMCYGPYDFGGDTIDEDIDMSAAKNIILDHKTRKKVKARLKKQLKENYYLKEKTTISEKVAGYREPKPDKTPFFDEGNVQTVQGQWKILTVTDADDINCANSNYCNLYETTCGNDSGGGGSDSTNSAQLGKSLLNIKTGLKRGSLRKTDPAKARYNLKRHKNRR